MATISLSDLPPKYQEQAVKKFMEQEARKQRVSSPALPCRTEKEKSSKYHNKPTERVTASGKVLKFDSMKEARRYDALLLRLRAGEIRDLRMQVDFTLQEAYTDAEGNRVRAIRYRADFVYEEYQSTIDGVPIWKPIVEDVKSRATSTPQYRMKKKLLASRRGLDITEV